MAWTIECQRGETITVDCCGSISDISELFSGLLITEDDLSENRIYLPFDIHIGSDHVFVSDGKDNSKKILLSDTSYSTVAEMAADIDKCRCCAQNGIYDNDVAAGNDGVVVGQIYELSLANTYGLPAGTLKVRRE